MPKTQLSNELTALATVKGFNDLAKRAADKASETLSLIWKAGETAKKAKDILSHGEWMNFVETHYIVDHRTVNRWMQFRENVSESKLDTVSNLTAGIKMLEAPKPKKKRKSKPPESGDDHIEEEAPVTDVEEPGTGECPNCGKSKWTEDEDGFDCAGCRHPWGECVGDRDEKLFRTQRSKTVKTAEALIRAFADLNRISARADYKEMIASCRQFIGIAKGWK